MGEKPESMHRAWLTSPRSFAGDPEFGDAVFHGNVMLAFIVIQNNDRAAALKYLREAMKAPVSTDASAWRPGPWGPVCSDLIRSGYRSEVIAFLEFFAQIDAPRRNELLASAAQLRYGHVPDWYRL